MQQPELLESMHEYGTEEAHMPQQVVQKHLLGSKNLHMHMRMEDAKRLCILPYAYDEKSAPMSINVHFFFPYTTKLNNFPKTLAPEMSQAANESSSQVLSNVCLVI